MFLVIVTACSSSCSSGSSSSSPYLVIAMSTGCQMRKGTLMSWSWSVNDGLSGNPRWNWQFDLLRCTNLVFTLRLAVISIGVDGTLGDLKWVSGGLLNPLSESWSAWSHRDIEQSLLLKSCRCWEARGTCWVTWSPWSSQQSPSCRQHPLPHRETNVCFLPWLIGHSWVASEFLHFAT